MMAPSLVNWLYVRVVELSVEVGLGIIRGLGDGNCLYVVCKWGEGQFEVASCVADVASCGWTEGPQMVASCGRTEGPQVGEDTLG